MEIGLEEFSRLLTIIYDAGLGIAPWERMLNELVAIFKGNTAAMLVTEPDLHYLLAASVGANPEAIQSYNNHYGHFDTVANTIQSSSAGAVISCSQVISPEERKRSMFYNEWAKYYETGDGVAGTLLQKNGSTSWIIITSPTRSSQPFVTAGRLKLMRQLLPHIQQSLNVQMRLEENQLQHSDELDVLARLSHGAILLSGKGRAVFINPAAEAIFSLADGLAINKVEHLQTWLPGENRKLEKMIGAACQENKDGLRSGGSMLISRPSHKRKFLLHILPLGTELPNLTGLAINAILLVADPENAPEPPPAILHNLFNLTAAEAKVAIQVIKDEKLQDVADKLSISLSTVRTHLQHVFEKTGTHRQAELTRLLLTLHAGVNMDTNKK